MRRNAPTRLIASAAAAGLLLAACGGDETDANGEVASSEAPETTEQDLSAKPEFTIDNEGEPPAELVIEDLVVGEGAEAKVGDTVSMHYVGKAWSNGAQFDASWDRGQTFDFTIGQGRVIAGWDQGIPGMKVGGRRKLVIPPDLGYGAAGAGGAIGPNETLVFVVDLVAIA